MGGGEEEETPELEGKRKEKEEAKVNRKVSFDLDATRLSKRRSLVLTSPIPLALRSLRSPI